MSNPTVEIGNTIAEPSDPQVVRDTFSRIIYDQQKFFTYGEGEFDPTYTTFDPTDKGNRSFFFIPLDDALVAVQPQFVSDNAWDNTVKKSASAFITAVNSIMPKIFMPSEKLVDNGVDTTAKVYFALPPGDVTKGLFNWVLTSVNGVAKGTGATDFYDFVRVGSFWGENYISVLAKDDALAENTVVMTLSNPASPPTGAGAGGWLLASGTDLVVTGAFAIMLNVVPSRPGLVDPDDVGKNPWTINFAFGEVEMELNDTGALKVKLGGESNQLTVNMAEGGSKEGPPQSKHVASPVVILVYPVWDGIVVSAGIQDSKSTVGPSSVFIPRLKGVSVLESPYSSGFDPTAPADVEVGIGSGATNVKVSFGTSLVVTAKNVRFDMAYLPCFFSSQGYFDEWFVTSDDTAETEFSHTVYPIWTKNGTSRVLTPAPTVIDSASDGPVADTTFSYIKWRMSQSAHNRFAPEIFGSILQTTETRDFPIKNGNGGFNVAFTGGTSGDPSPLSDWWRYILNLSVTVGIDGSSGNITMDKYGFAGQEAEATQSIGAVTVTATGGEGTVSGSIFQGFGIGISETMSSDGATWEIPLVGLEQKLDDIALINVPFFDGEKLSDAFDFLVRYAGIIGDQSNAPTASGIRLQASEDINVARFDWKSGTSIRSALDDVMEDTLHHYVVRDGKIFLYRLNGFTGLPTNVGPDREPSYPSTLVVTQDQNPDFEDLRNEIVVIALRAILDGQGSDVSNPPTFPRIATVTNVTTPDVPWAKSIIRPLPGFLTQDEIEDSASRIAVELSTYEILGRTTIPGNANIKPYDQWGDFLIYSITHNIDFQAKSWTTDLEFGSPT